MDRYGDLISNDYLVFQIFKICKTITLEMRHRVLISNKEISIFVILRKFI